MAGSAQRSLHRNPIAACCAVVFALTAPATASAGTWTVDSCDQGSSGDLGMQTGTLRFAAANAASGDAIDMTSLACGTISLQTGSIKFSQNDITVLGPGSGSLTISGKFTRNSNTYSDKDRIIRHSGTGQLSIYGLSVRDGDLSVTTASGIARGGCIYSKGDAYLSDVQASHCSAKVTSGNAYGGAIYAVGSVYLMHSTVTASSATNGSSGSYDYAAGGGVFSRGEFTASDSTIDGNTARGPLGQKIGVGGGVFANASTTLYRSTISNNVAGRNAGGFDAFNGDPATIVAAIVDSTISGNSAGYLVGGAYLNSGQVTIDNSTIAFNLAASKTRTYPAAYFAAGLVIGSLFADVAVDLQSSIVSNNLVKTKQWDLTAPYAGALHSVSFSMAPANNLVRFADAAAQALLPGDTIDGCPYLGPLRDNGGPTLTHAPSSGSPAIDAGNNVAMLDFDQRGSPFARESGTSADIGSTEVQQNDTIFMAGLDGCPALP